MDHILGDLLRGLRSEPTHLAFAIMRPRPSPQVWDLLWCSLEDYPDSFHGKLSSSPAELSWSNRSVLGLALHSRLEPLGVLGWDTGPQTEDGTELRRALERCRERYYEACERQWLRLAEGLLTALKEQRREVGAAIHRGPAQALTAARIELSMMGQSTQAGPVAQAIEQASEGLVQLVHGKLRGRRQEPTLVGTLLSELDFQARWHGLPPEAGTVTLPEGASSGALAELWRLTGGEVHRSNGTATFILRGLP